jgi:hypothetical protein
VLSPGLSIRHLAYSAADDKRKNLRPVNRSSTALAEQLVRPQPNKPRKSLVTWKKPSVDWPRTGLTGMTTTIKPWTHQGTE